ncbi:MAG: hypothetical protein IPM29_13020 [Planctomycetes bacterium]|nr:hypothetical protein [Planctomycetota bacterium]
MTQVPQGSTPTGGRGAGLPLLLLGLGALVLVEPWLPGRAWITETVGETALLRFALAGACAVLALLVVDRQRTAVLLRTLLGELQRVGRAARGGAEPSAAERDEAVRILISALDSGDPNTRQTAHGHLVRLTGIDLGTASGAWRERFGTAHDS